MPEKSVIAYLGLGSNLGDREANLRQATEAIGAFPDTQALRVSPLYTSEPWGPVEQDRFLNLVVEIRTPLDPHALLSLSKDAEKQLGRIESVRWGPRAIDIDILLYGEISVRTDKLTVPHARMWERAFVLKPLADLRPDLRDPGGGLIVDVLASPDIAGQGVWLYKGAQEPGNGE